MSKTPYAITDDGDGDVWIVNSKTDERILWFTSKSRAKDVLKKLNSAYLLGKEDEWLEATERAQKTMERLGI